MGLAALALTDHDTIEGVAPARAAAAERRLEFVPGIEFSSNIDGKEVHILGIFIDDGSDLLGAAAAQARQHRRERAGEIAATLTELGQPLDFASIEQIAGSGSMGRPHIAGAMVEQGLVDTVDAAFRRYLGVGRPAYVPKPTLPADRVIEVIHAAGGISLLAHPGSSRVEEESIATLVDLGLDGIEVQHPKHRPHQVRALKSMTNRLGLLPSGGSDFHGPGGRTPLGSHAVPLEWLEALRRRADEYREQNSR